MKVLVVALVAFVACKNRDNASPSAGSSAPAPTTPVADAPATQPEPTAPTFSQTIMSNGVGPITATTDVATLTSLFPGVQAKTEHAEGSGSSTDTTTLTWSNGVTILKVTVDNAQAELRVDVLASSFATQSGIRVGATVGDLLHAHPDTECRRETPPGAAQVLLCATPSLPNVSFHLDPAALTGSDGKVAAARVAAFKIVHIMWRQTRTATGAAAGKPFCLTAGTEQVLDRLVATNDSATFCAAGAGTLSCAKISLATGEVTPVTGAPPPKTVPEEPKRTSPDGAKQLARSGNMWSLVDVKNSKSTVKLAITDKDHTCAGDAQFLGPSIFVTATSCDKPHAVGYVFSAKGSTLGEKIDAVNIHDAKPYHLDANRWLFHSSDSEDILFVDMGKGRQAVTQTQSAPEGIHLRSSIVPFVKTPNGKIVVVGAVVAVMDPMTGSIDKSWVLPVCAK